MSAVKVKADDAASVYREEIRATVANYKEVVAFSFGHHGASTNLLASTSFHSLTDLVAMNFFIHCRRVLCRYLWAS
jgi:hypothetical protein